MFWASKDLKLKDIILEASKMNYWFFFLSALITVAANYSRALRWRYLIEAFGHQIKTKNLFLSVMMMYLSNLIFPRSGEVTRCGTVYKYEKVPVKTLLGTVVIERLFDVISLLFLIVVLLIIQFDIVKRLYLGSQLPSMINSLSNNSLLLLSIFLSGALFLIIVYSLRQKIRRFAIIEKLFQIISEMRIGIIKVLKMNNMSRFFLQTLLMWIFYLGSIAVCFFAYPPTENLGFAAYFSVLIAGSLGMIAPTNGGIGAWHAMVILTLGIFGLSQTESVSIAHVAFGVNMLSIIISGAISFMILPYLNNNNSKFKIKFLKKSKK